MIMAENKIVLVVRPTRLDNLVVRHNTIQQAQFYVEHLGADFSDYLAEHRRYHEAARATEALLRDLGRVQRLQRQFLANFIFGPEDTVVVLGQDGLVANTLKYLDGQHGRRQSGPRPLGRRAAAIHDRRPGACHAGGTAAQACRQGRYHGKGGAQQRADPACRE
jgi:hypothetical protein